MYITSITNLSLGSHAVYHMCSHGISYGGMITRTIILHVFSRDFIWWHDHTNHYITCSHGISYGGMITRTLISRVRTGSHGGHITRTIISRVRTGFHGGHIVITRTTRGLHHVSHWKFNLVENWTVIYLVHTGCGSRMGSRRPIRCVCAEGVALCSRARPIRQPYDSPARHAHPRPLAWKDSGFITNVNKLCYGSRTSNYY